MEIEWVTGVTNFRLFNFNKVTGVVTPDISIQPIMQSGFTSAFSSDGTKLYIGGLVGLVQLDLSLYPNVTAIENSETKLSDTSVGRMRLGPDGKIYFGDYNSIYLNCVNVPNALGMASLPSYHVLDLSNSNPTTIFIELGNPVPVVHTNAAIVTSSRDTICNEIPLTLNASQICPYYHWNTGASTASITATAGGKYWVKGFKDCTAYIDTFDVHTQNLKAILGPDTTICNGATLLLNPDVNGTDYTWQDGSSNPTFLVSKAGTYSVTISGSRCRGTDSIHVDVVIPFLNIAEPDTTFCQGTSFTLHAIARPESIFSWNTGSSNATIVTSSPGTYAVKATNVCGIYYDSVNVRTEPCYCNAFVPSAFSPNGDGLNDALIAMMNCPGLTDFVMKIYNRYGQQMFKSSDINTGWDGNHNGQKADLGTYFYYLRYKTKDGEIITKKGDVTLIR